MVGEAITGDSIMLQLLISFEKDFHYQEVVKVVELSLQWPTCTKSIEYNTHSKALYSSRVKHLSLFRKSVSYIKWTLRNESILSQ